MEQFVRKMILRLPDGSERKIQVNISQPYFPAKRSGFEALHACEIHFPAGDDVSRETYGLDALQAFGSAVFLLDHYLLRKKNKSKGQLFWEDGAPYDPEEDGVLRRLKIWDDKGNFIGRKGLLDKLDD